MDTHVCDPNAIVCDECGEPTPRNCDECGGIYPTTGHGGSDCICAARGWS